MPDNDDNDQTKQKTQTNRVKGQGNKVSLNLIYMKMFVNQWMYIQLGRWRRQKVLANIRNTAIT